MSDPRGPYINEAASEFYYPVRGWAYNEARSDAASEANFMDAWTRTKYEGKRDISLHDHDDWEECETCPKEPCWTFSTYEGTYRG